MTGAAEVDVVVIGAGMAGLTAAERLAESGLQVLVVDKGRSVGGRLATRRIGEATLDHGAQFFTARSDRFSEAVDRWVGSGVVDVWCNGFGDEPDGHPRFRSRGGMSQLAKHLAGRLRTAGVQTVTHARAAAIIDDGDRLVITYDGAAREPDRGRAVVATPPVPQTIALLEAGTGSVPERARSISYDPVIALLFTTSTDVSDRLGPAGALQQPDDPTFTFVADNEIKGISGRRAITMHAAPGLSEEIYGLPDTAVVERLDPELRRTLGDIEIGELQVKRWRYAAPRQGHDERTLVTGAAGRPVVLAGDAFGEARVEGAFLSGLAAADVIVDSLG